MGSNDFYLRDFMHRKPYDTLGGIALEQRKVQVVCIPVPWCPPFPAFEVFHLGPWPTQPNVNVEEKQLEMP